MWDCRGINLGPWDQCGIISFSQCQYYNAFRAITVEAVTYPVTGPEACAAFRAGLKPALLELIMKDASVRREMSNVEAVVKAAKEAESLLAMLSGVSKGKEKVYGDREEGELPRDRGTKRPAHNHPKGATRHLGKLQKKYGLSQDRREAAGKLASGVCFECNKPGHFAFECPLKKGLLVRRQAPAQDLLMLEGEQGHGDAGLWSFLQCGQCRLC
eukprot:jgi/Botrbrau1/18075/Bobra.0062s0061.1